MVADRQRVEALGPAEKILNSLTQYTDHMVHNRPGLIVQDARTKVGVRWDQATWIKENDLKVVYRVTKAGKKQVKTRAGVMNGTDEVKDGNRVIGRFKSPGLFPEVVSFLYQQVADIWKLDNEFAAKWASYAFENEENRDLKVLLASFMLVQSRFGEPIKDGDEFFRDEDYRAVGEAMCLLRAPKKGYTFNPKLLLRIGEVLELPGVVEINRKMGFGQSGRSAVIGRYYKVIEKWLAHCELNVKLLELLLKDGHRRGIMRLAQKVGYKPTTEKFFELLRWKQVQAKDGRRTVMLGKKVKKADRWDDLTEVQICEKITKSKPGYKVIAGKVPAAIGITPAIMSAAIEAGCLSDADLIILTPTLEELGLLKDKDVGARWKQAVERAENQRAANIARNVKTQEAKEGLTQAADNAAAKAVEAVTKDLRTYVIVDKSGSMTGETIERAKWFLSKFVGAFPLDRLHVVLFNTVAQDIEIKRATQAGVEQAFRGHTANGGTSYYEGARAALRHKPKEGEDALLIFVGDQEDNRPDLLAESIRASGVDPVGFGMLHVASNQRMMGYPDDVVLQAAALLGKPCFRIDEGIFNDAYAVTRVIRNLLAATPVGKPTGPAPVKRVTLIQQILDTKLLQKPAWA